MMQSFKIIVDVDIEWPMEFKLIADFFRYCPIGNCPPVFIVSHHAKQGTVVAVWFGGEDRRAGTNVVERRGERWRGWTWRREGWREKSEERRIKNTGS